MGALRVAKWRHISQTHRGLDAKASNPKAKVKAQGVYHPKAVAGGELRAGGPGRSSQDPLPDGRGVPGVLRHRGGPRSRVTLLSLLVPEEEALKVEAKRAAEAGRALNQVLSGEDVDRAGVTSMPHAGSAHEPLELA
jgi:hypothetical protein